MHAPSHTNISRIILYNHKKFSEWKQVHVGIVPSKTNKLDWNDTTKLSQHPYILCHFADYALCLLVVFIGRLRKAVGWVVLSVQCMLMCMLMCIESKLYVGVAATCYWTWQMWSVMYAESVEWMSIAVSVWYVGVWVMLWTFVTAECGTYGLFCMEKAVEWAAMSALLVCTYAFI